MDDLPFYLAGLYHGFRGLLERTRMDSALHQHMVSPGMGSIFLLLCHEDDCIIKQLAARLKIPNATLTGLLDRMEESGVIERHPCPNDGRAFRVRLTEFGHSLEAGMQQRHQLSTQILQSGLSKPEVAELKRLLARVLANLHQDEAAWRSAQKAERAKARAARFARAKQRKSTK
jgi:DNA-binding MarR family transcriptional regulator